MKIFSPHLPKLLECHSMLLDELRTKFNAGEGVKAVSETLDFYAPFFKITVCPPPAARFVVCCMSSVACRPLHAVRCMSSTLPPSRRRRLRCAARALLRWELRDSPLSRSRSSACGTPVGGRLTARAEPSRAGGRPQQRRRRGTLVVGRCSTSTTTQT
jgi:hypothetical protein